MIHSLPTFPDSPTYPIGKFRLPSLARVTPLNIRQNQKRIYHHEQRGLSCGAMVCLLRSLSAMHSKNPAEQKEIHHTPRYAWWTPKGGDQMKNRKVSDSNCKYTTTAPRDKMCAEKETAVYRPKYTTVLWRWLHMPNRKRIRNQHQRHC